MKIFGPKQKAPPVEKQKGQTQKVKADLDDIVFAGRNKSYGAYTNRKEDGIRHFNAVLIGGLLFAAVVWGFAVIDLRPETEANTHATNLNLVSIDEGSGSKKQLKTVNYNGSDEAIGYNGVALGGFDLPVKISTEANILNLSGDEAAEWERAYNLSEGKKMVSKLRLPEPVEVNNTRGSFEIKVWLNKEGQIENYEFSKEAAPEIEPVLARSLLGQQLPPVIIEGEAQKAVIRLSLHYGI